MLQTDGKSAYPARSVQLFLGVAFATLLAFLLGTGWNAISTLSEMHAREEAARSDFLSRTEPIVQVRSKLTVYGNLTQEFTVAEGKSFPKLKIFFARCKRSWNNILSFANRTSGSWLTICGR